MAEHAVSLQPADAAHKDGCFHSLAAVSRGDVEFADAAIVGTTNLAIGRKEHCHA